MRKMKYLGLYIVCVLLSISTYAQLDESVLEDQMLLAEVDRKLDSLSAFKDDMLYAGLFKDVIYLNRIENKRNDGSLTKEEAEEFMILDFEIFKKIANLLFGEHADNYDGNYEEDDSDYESKIVDLGKEIDLSQYAENGKISFITPGGTYISLPQDSKPTFTGRTGSSKLDSDLFKGVLLGFVDRDGSGWTAKFAPEESGWTFKGYVKYRSENEEPYPYEDEASSGTILVGSETEDCKLRISSGELSANAYVFDEHSEILTSSPTSFEFIKEIDLELDECNEINLSDYIYLADDLIAETSELREENFDSDADKVAQSIDASDKFVIISDEISFDSQSERKLEALEEKLKMLNLSTNKLFIVAFSKVGYAIPEESLNTFSEKITASSSRLQNATESYVISIPIFTSSRIPVNGPLKLEKFYVGMQGGTASVESVLADFDPSQDVYENTINAYSKIEKPYKQIVHFLRVDGTAGSFVAENSSNKKGERNIIDLILYYDKRNIERVANFKDQIVTAAEKRDVYKTIELINERSQFISSALESSSVDDYEVLSFESRLRESSVEKPSNISEIQNHVVYTKSIFNTLYNQPNTNNFDFSGYADVSDGALFEVDMSKYIYGAIDAVSIGLAPFGVDFVADAAGVIYAMSRGDHVDASIYGGSIILVGGTDVPIKALRAGQRFIVNGGEIFFKGAPNFATGIKSALNTTDDAIANSSKLFDFLDNKVLRDKIDDAAAKGLDKNKLFNDLGSSDELMDAFLKEPELVDAWGILFKEGDAASELVRRNPENLEKLSKFISETGMEESKLISSFGNTKNPQKWIDMKIPESDLDAVYDGFKNSPPAKFEAWTPDHKAQRWQNHKAGNPDADYKNWSNQYDGNIDKAIAANRGVDDFFSGMSGNVVREKSFQNISITTAEGTQTFTRRLDIVDEDAFKGIEFKEYSNGKVYRSPDIRREYALDAELLELDALDEIEWIFKGCEPSAPLRADLESLGIKITLLP